MKINKKVIVVIDPEDSMDCVVCVADSEEAAAFYLKTTVEKMRQNYFLDEHSIITQTDDSVNNTHPYIWGDGWYAIPDMDHENNWCLAPIKFFDEKGYCPDGWDWEKPEGLSDDEFSDFIDEHGCEPEIPNMFGYCMELTIECYEKISMEEQKQILKDFGYVVDNIPKWKYERNE